MLRCRTALSSARRRWLTAGVVCAVFLATVALSSVGQSSGREPPALRIGDHLTARTGLFSPARVTNSSLPATASDGAVGVSRLAAEPTRTRVTEAYEDTVIWPGSSA